MGEVTVVIPDVAGWLTSNLALIALLFFMFVMVAVNLWLWLMTKFKTIIKLVVSITIILAFLWIVGMAIILF